MDVRDIIELVNLVASREISELEVEREGVRVRIVRAPLGAAAPVAGGLTYEPPAIARSSSAVSVEHVAERAAAAAPPPQDEGEVHVMKAPIVGTFYRAPSPSAEPYVKAGDRVKKGQVVCIVEAMKLMNEIESEVSGVVLEVLAEDGQPVEYGQPLFRLRPER